MQTQVYDHSCPSIYVLLFELVIFTNQYQSGECGCGGQKICVEIPCAQDCKDLMCSFMEVSGPRSMQSWYVFFFPSWAGLVVVTFLETQWALKVLSLLGTQLSLFIFHVQSLSGAQIQLLHKQRLLLLFSILTKHSSEMLPRLILRSNGGNLWG